MTCPESVSAVEAVASVVMLLALILFLVKLNNEDRGGDDQ